MQLPTRVTHAIDLLVKLHGAQGHLSLAKLAEGAGISAKYADVIVSDLKKAGLVRAIRGSKGGYLLARPADQIQVIDVLRSVDGDVFPLTPGDSNEVAVLKEALVKTTREILGWCIVDLTLLDSLLGPGGDAVTTEDKILEILADQFDTTGADLEELDRNDDLYDAFRADSLDAVEVLMKCEEAFDIAIQDQDAEKVKTLGELIDLVERIKS